MSNFDNIPQVIFPTNTFTKKWDQLILTGEVYRAKVHPKALKAEDKAYSISVKLSKESYLQLKKLKMDSTDKDGNILTSGNRPLTGLKKVELKVKDDNGEEVLDDEGDPAKEFSHYQMSVYQNRKIKGQDVVLPVVMSADNAPVDSFLNEGTKVSILCQTYETIFRDKPAMGMNLKEVKVHELVAYEGGSSGGVDPWASLGMTAADVPSFDTPAETPKEEAPQQSSLQAQPEPPQPAQGFDDFDDDVPF